MPYESRCFSLWHDITGNVSDHLILFTWEERIIWIMWGNKRLWHLGCQMASTEPLNLSNKEITLWLNSGFLWWCSYPSVCKAQTGWEPKPREGGKESSSADFEFVISVRPLLSLTPIQNELVLPLERGWLTTSSLVYFHSLCFQNCH